MSRYSPDEIIDGLRRRDNRVMRYIYKNYYPAVLKLVMTNNGTEEDAKDVFQETLIAVFRNIRKEENFQLKHSFSTYIYSISRLLWLKNLRDSRNSEKNLKENHPYVDFEDPKPFNEEDLRYSAYQRAFGKIPDDCKKILKMTVDGVSQKEIASQLGLKSENYIKKRKHYCKEYLIQKIKEDPDFQENKD